MDNSLSEVKSRDNFSENLNTDSKIELDTDIEALRCVLADLKESFHSALEFKKLDGGKNSADSSQLNDFNCN